MKKQLRIGSGLAVLALALTACGGGGGGGAISGRVSAGGTGAVVVVACFNTLAECPEDRSKAVAAAAGGSYVIEGLAAGSYQVAAIQDTNGNGQVDQGDAGGVYADPQGQPAAVRPPASNINITIRASANALGAGAQRLMQSLPGAPGRRP